MSHAVVPPRVCVWWGERLNGASQLQLKHSSHRNFIPCWWLFPHPTLMHCPTPACTGRSLHTDALGKDTLQDADSKMQEGLVHNCIALAQQQFQLSCSTATCKGSWWQRRVQTDPQVASLHPTLRECQLQDCTHNRSNTFAVGMGE